MKDRDGDIEQLIDHILGSNWQLDEEARNCLLAYHWPGNVRQLINVLERATILADDGEIVIDDLPREVIAAAARTLMATRLTSTHRMFKNQPERSDQTQLPAFVLKIWNAPTSCRFCEQTTATRRRLHVRWEFIGGSCIECSIDSTSSRKRFILSDFSRL